MSVTILVPTYRRPYFLKRTLTSIAKQSYDDFIVHILDDASGDETGEVAQAFAVQDSRFVYHCNETNIGNFNNLSHGLGLVNTSYFCYLADDDLWLPGFLEKAVKAMERNHQAACYGGTSIYIDECGIPFRFSGPGEFEGLLYPPKGLVHLLEKGWPQQVATLYRSEVLKEIGGISPILSFDLDYLVRISSIFPVYFSSRVSGFYTISSSSVSGSRTISLMSKEWQSIRDRITTNKKIATNIKNKIVDEWDHRMPYELRIIIFTSLKRGDIEDAKEGLRLLRQYRFLWFTPAICLAIVLAGLSGIFCRMIQWLFKQREILFIYIRKMIFKMKYHNVYPEYWLAEDLTKIIRIENQSR